MRFRTGIQGSEFLQAGRRQARVVVKRFPNVPSQT